MGLAMHLSVVSWQHSFEGGSWLTAARRGLITVHKGLTSSLLPMLLFPAGWLLCRCHRDPALWVHFPTRTLMHTMKQQAGAKGQKFVLASMLHVLTWWPQANVGQISLHLPKLQNGWLEGPPACSPYCTCKTKVSTALQPSSEDVSKAAE